MPAALPSTLNTAGDVSHMKYGPNEQKYWILQCQEEEEVNIKWTSFNIGNDSLWMGQRENRVWSTFFNASGLDTAEDFTFPSNNRTGVAYVFYSSEVDSDGGDFAFRYECLSPPTAEPTALPEGHTLVPTTEAPSSAAMTWCTSDAQCKQHGDTAATCKDNGHCARGDGFVKPFDVDSGRRAHICVTSETRVSDVVYVSYKILRS